MPGLNEVVGATGTSVVVTCASSTCFGAHTKIVDTYTNELGNTLYIMANGQWLTANEFKKE